MASLKPENTDSSSQWAWLHDDLLNLITDKLDELSDYVRFGAVCKGWLSFSHRYYNQKHLLHTNKQLPLLLVPLEGQQERSLYNITTGVTYDQIQLNLPYKRCCGSSHGWLFFVDNKFSLELILINPFLGEGESAIKLPPIDFLDNNEVLGMDEYGVMKAVLSKDPYFFPNDYEVMVIYGGLGNLAHYKAGDKFWTYPPTEKLQAFADVIFYKGSVYAVNYYNRIVKVTLQRFKKSPTHNSSPCFLHFKSISKKSSDEICFYAAGQAYLVGTSKGELLLVRRFYRDEHEIDREDKPHLSKYFEVYKLNFPSARKKLRIKRFHDEALFLGDNHSLSISTSGYPHLVSNSIYYTDDYIDNYRSSIFGFCDTGIFNTENEGFSKHFIPNFSIKDMPPTIFIVPRYRCNLKTIS